MTVGLLFSAAVVGLMLLVVVAANRAFIEPFSVRPHQHSTNLVACWVSPSTINTNVGHYDMTFIMPTTNYNGAVVFGQLPGTTEWVHEGHQYGGLGTQIVTVTIFRPIRLLIIPPFKSEWQESH